MQTTTRKSTCDHCHKPFTVITRTERISGRGEAWYFACPHCGHRYNVCTITRQGIQLRQQIESIKAQLRLAPHNTDLATKKDQLQAAFLAEVTSTLNPATAGDNDSGITSAVLTPNQKDTA